MFDVWGKKIEQFWESRQNSFPFFQRAEKVKRFDKDQAQSLVDVFF